MEEIDELSARFWAWRAQSQPRSRDDIPRLDRPPGWRPDIGAEAIGRRRLERDGFADELAKISPIGVADRVDHRLLHSAISRITWELDVIEVWRQPRFYIDQALGPVFDVLLRPGVDSDRVAEVIRYLELVPSVVEAARTVLADSAAKEFAELAIGELVGIDARLAGLASALTVVDPAAEAQLAGVASVAGAVLVDYREWLTESVPSLSPATPVGRSAYEWFLREVACIPLTAARIREIGRLESDRAVVLELLERGRRRGMPEPELPATIEEQVDREARDESAVRAFYVEQRLLNQPDSLAHYRNAPMPAYLEPLRFLGVADDLTGPTRLDEDGISYAPPPGPDLPYFYAANARDPRAGIVHEGAHYQQLALAWRHDRPVRRHYYDSSANEGIAFYNEELMLAAGLFEDQPATRVTMYNFMRLRALRVELDVGLAVGDLSIEQAAGLLEETVPMDAETAREEAAFFAETPGQALTYQIGKTQLLALIAEASRRPGFDLMALHDALWVNGNVPIALLRWEMLGLTDELDAIGCSYE